MKLSPRYTLPAAIALALGVGLTGGIMIPTPGPPATAHTIQEDDPGWDCATMGNRICGPLTDEAKAAGWQAWDDGHGSRSLKVDPSRPYRVDYVGVSDVAPTLTEDKAAVVGKDFKWHVFRVIYTR